MGSCFLPSGTYLAKQGDSPGGKFSDSLVYSQFIIVALSPILGEFVMGPNRKIEVAVIEDNEEERREIEAGVNREPDLVCISSYPDCETALANLEQDAPEVVLLDIGLGPGHMTGVDGAWEIKKRWPEIEIIMLTVYSDERYIFDALRNGASGYLVKSRVPENLPEAIREVMQKGAPMSMSIARKVTQYFKRTQSPNELSAREKDVLQHLCDGESYQAIADTLFLSRETIKFHIRNIYHKLHVTNKAEAVRKATREGFVD